MLAGAIDALSGDLYNIFRNDINMKGKKWKGEMIKKYVNKKESKQLSVDIAGVRLMKATVLAESSNNLSIFIVIFLLQQCLLTVARQLSLSFFLNILHNERTLRWDFKIHKVMCVFMNKYIFPD